MSDSAFDNKRVIWQDLSQSIEIIEQDGPDGTKVERPVIRQLPGVVICALNESQQCLIVEVPRPVVRKRLLELPAGKVEPCEDVLDAAKRELEEECAVRAEEWQPLGADWGAQGSSDWMCHYFLAQNVAKVERQQKTDGELASRWIPMDQCLEWIFSGRICNNFSIVGILKALYHLSSL